MQGSLNGPVLSATSFRQLFVIVFFSKSLNLSTVHVRVLPNTLLFLFCVVNFCIQATRTTPVLQVCYIGFCWSQRNFLSYKKRMTLIGFLVSSCASYKAPPMGKLYPVNYPAYSLTTPFTRPDSDVLSSDSLYSCRYYYNTTWY